jgi:hypothetical protein
MKTLTRIVFLLAASAWLVEPAPAQEVQVQPIIAPFAANPLTLLENKDVQKDLKLSEEQSKKITALGEKFKEGQQGLKNLKGRERFQKSKELSDAIRQDADALLNEGQKKRIKQLEVQQQGPGVFFNQRLTGDLKLSDEQKAKVREVFKDMTARRAEIVKAAQGNREELQKKVAELSQNAVADIVKSFTEDQKKAWGDIAGEPFKGVLPPAGFGGVLRPGIQIQPLPGNNRPIPQLPRPKAQPKAKPPIL